MFTFYNVVIVNGSTYDTIIQIRLNTKRDVDDYIDAGHFDNIYYEIYECKKKLIEVRNSSKEI